MLLLGTTIIGVGAAVVTYFVSFGALSWRRRHRAAHAARLAEAQAPYRDLGSAAGVPKGREPAA